MQPFMQTKGHKDFSELRQKRVKQQVLTDNTVRDFGGGWNVVDSQLNLDSKFQPLIENVAREEDGSIGIRFGTQLFREFTGEQQIINCTYFMDHIITVHEDGAFWATRGDGTSYEIIPASGAWGLMDFACFAVFKGSLYITNGINKPMEIYTDDPAAVPIELKARPLNNPTTVSNANVPVARYVVAHKQFLIFGNSVTAGAGSDFGENWLHISAKDSPGVFAADYDPATNSTYYASTAVDVDIGAWGIDGDHVITGLNTFRDKLVVGTPNAVALGDLGIKPGTAAIDAEGNDIHTPDFSDILDSVGCHSHRSMVNTGTDLLFVDHIGVVSLSRSLYSGDVEPKRVSELIDPALSANVSRIRQNTMRDGCHALYNSREKQYMLFMANHDPNDGAIQLVNDPCFADNDDTDVIHIQWRGHNMNPGDYFDIQGMEPWNNITDGSVYNGVHQVVRVIDDDSLSIAALEDLEPLHPEKVGGGANITVERQYTESTGYIYTRIPELKVKAWARYRSWKWQSSCQSELSTVFFTQDNKLYVYGNTSQPLYEDYMDTNATAGSGQPIQWAWEMPWVDFNKRMQEKHSRFIAFDTTGDSDFDVLMFVDSLYKRVGALIPNNIMTFQGGDSTGYGDGQQPYGGGIHTADERLTSWTARFKLAKIRLQGSSTRPLRIISISVAYQSGKYRR